MSYLLKLWNLLSNIGVQSKMPFYIKKRVNITNRFSWIMIVICSSLIVVFFNDPHFKKNSLIALLTLGVFILLSNRLHFTGLSRFLLSICPAILLLISSIIVKLQGTQNVSLEHYLSIQYVIGATIVLPFTLFHWREKVAMFSSVFLVLLIAIFFNKIHTWFDVSMQDLGVRVTSQAIINTNLYITFALLFLSLLFLLSMNNRYSRDSDKLLEQLTQKNKLAKQREHDLQKTLNQLQESRIQEQQQSWITKGLADFATYFRKQQDLKSLSNQIISALIKYVEAVQGAIYVVKNDEQEVSIELSASYAFDKFSYEKRRYIPHEGLIGQVYAQRKKIALNDIPDDYLNISSGLGKTIPKYLLIIPIFNEDAVEGVIEIASFQAIESYKVEFIERLSENLASAMLSIKVNELSQSLLQKSQKQTKTLELQEKELKSHFTQLEKTEKQAEKVQNELAYTFKALEKSMLVVEFDTQKRFININKNFEKLLGYTIDDLQGKEYKSIMNMQDFDNEAYQNLWQKLNNKQPDVGEYMLIANLGYYLWFRGTFSPILDDEGNIIKILLFAYNITAEKEQEITLQEQNRIIQNHEKLMMEQLKSAQDNAYQKIKKMKEEYEKKLSDMQFKLKEKEDLNYN